MYIQSVSYCLDLRATSVNIISRYVLCYVSLFVDTSALFFKPGILCFTNSMWYAKCLRQTGSGGYNFPKTLPGKYMTIEEQCKNYVKGKPCPVSTQT